MRIGIDARMYSESGIGRYIRNLLYYLQKLDKKNEYYIFLLKDQYDRLVYHTNFHKVLADFRWYGIKEQIKSPSLLNSYNLDLVHFPHFNVPVFYQGKFVVTIHDLIHQHYQMRRATTHNPITYKIKQLGYKLVFKTAVNKSQQIFTPSEFVKNQLVSEWRVRGKKVAVTYEGVDDQILAIAKIWDKGKGQKILEKYGVKPPYIFYVGNAHPHKNVEGLIKAFLNLRQRYQYLQLVLSGADHYFWQKVKKDYQHKDIIYTGYITDEQLVALYKNAQCFVMPSFEEGFGIPLLEAMACSCPVVTSAAGSLPEVGGEAGLYFDPHDLEDMVDKIEQVLNDQTLRKELIVKGQTRYQQFSWMKLVQQTLAVYYQQI